MQKKIKKYGTLRCICSRIRLYFLKKYYIVPKCIELRKNKKQRIGKRVFFHAHILPEGGPGIEKVD